MTKHNLSRFARRAGGWPGTVAGSAGGLPLNATAATVGGRDAVCGMAKVIGVCAIIERGRRFCQVKWWVCIPMICLERPERDGRSDHGDSMLAEESMQVGVFGDHNQAALGSARDNNMIG